MEISFIKTNVKNIKQNSQCLFWKISSVHKNLFFGLVSLVQILKKAPHEQISATLQFSLRFPAQEKKKKEKETQINLFIH